MPELHTIYRSESWDEVFGNENLKNILQEKIQNNDLPHAILFHGKQGCGKTSCARLLAREMKCAENNILEYNMAHYTGVQEMRKITDSIKFS